MQRDVPIREAAKLLGMSPEAPQGTHGHYHSDYLRGAAAAIGQTANVPAAEPPPT